MGGSVTFQEALKMRLDIINITQQQLSDFIESKNPEEILTPGIPWVDKDGTVYGFITLCHTCLVNWCLCCSVGRLQFILCLEAFDLS